MSTREPSQLHLMETISRSSCFPGSMRRALPKGFASRPCSFHILRLCLRLTATSSPPLASKCSTGPSICKTPESYSLHCPIVYSVEQNLSKKYDDRYSYFHLTWRISMQMMTLWSHQLWQRCLERSLNLHSYILVQQLLTAKWVGIL